MTNGGWDLPGQGRPISNLEVNILTNRPETAAQSSGVEGSYVPTPQLTQGDLRKALTVVTQSL